jgi:hypothetical protein
MQPKKAEYAATPAAPQGHKKSRSLNQNDNRL